MVKEMKDLGGARKFGWRLRLAAGLRHKNARLAARGRASR